MKVQSLALAVLLFNISLVHAVKLTLIDKTGESKLAISPCPNGNCDNYRHADRYNLPSTIVEFSGTYVIDTNSSTFKQYPLVTVHTIGDNQLFDKLDTSSYKQDATFFIEKGRNWIGIPTFKIKKQ